jgi:LPXTG-site transpeptidase (sortase) family protein
MAKDKSAKNKAQPRKIVPVKVVRAGLLGLAAIMLTLGVTRFVNRHRVSTGPTELPNSQAIITEDSSEPAESKPDEAAYAVAFDQPRSIKLDTIDSGGLVQRVGLTKENAMSAPSNVHYAGWYTGSVKPGDTGLSIIDGHVSGKYVDGIFKNLPNLSIGDLFTVEYGDYSTRSFEVVELRTLPEKNSADFLFTKRSDIKKQLNLITCGGKFNKDTQTYDDRVVIVSKAVN